MLADRRKPVQQAGDAHQALGMGRICTARARASLPACLLPGAYFFFFIICGYKILLLME